MRRTSWIVPSVILILTAGVLAVWWLKFEQAKDSVFRSLMRKLTGQIEAEFARVFDPVTTNLLIAETWGEEGILSLDEAQKLNANFMAVMDRVPQISAVTIADGDGASYMLQRRDGQWLTRRTNAKQWPERSLWKRWAAPSQSVEQWWRQTDFDPRTRPWFQGAVAAADDGVPLSWTEPYVFATTRRPGMTASIRYRDEEATETVHVVAFDVLLADIAERMAALPVGESGKAFIMTATGHVIAMTGDRPYAGRELTPGAELPAIGSLDAPVRDAVADWEAQGREAGDPEHYRSGGTSWWAGFRPYQLGQRTLWIGIALPEAELIERIGGVSRVLPMTIVVVGMVAALGSVLVLSRRSAAVEPTAPAQQAVAVGNDLSPEAVRALIGEGESDRLEFKSTVRFNLRAGKPGKEMELAWLKTVVGYLNTEGGTIVIGVDDDGGVLGLDADGFANDDKCLRHIGNLITEHVGTEQTPFVGLRMVAMNEGKVVVIRVRRSPQPAFLRVGKEEQFYIRSGPASRELPPSRILAYLEARKLG